MDNDEDLAKAIALSLQDEHITTPKDNEDYEDEDNIHQDVSFDGQLQKALAESKQATSSGQASTSATPPPPPATTPAVPSFLSERQQMEKERLARQKRMRSEAGLDDEDEAEEAKVERPMKRQQLSSSVPSTRANASTSTKPVASQTTSATTNSTTTFYDGEFRPTATRHADPRRDGKATFRLTEILGPKSDLAFCILSAMDIDVPWLYEFFDPATPVILVGTPGPSGEASIRNILPNWVKTTPFLRNGYGVQHMKFMLLFHKTGSLRVVVSSANLIPLDYRDNENVVWLQDIPARNDGKQPLEDATVSEDFPSMFQRVLHGVNVKPALVSLRAQGHPDILLSAIEDLRRKWDFSKVRVHLVASIAGKHEGWPDVIKTGHLRLMKIIRNMGMRTTGKQTLSLECQGSSLGVYTTQWMNEFYASARGNSGRELLNKTKKAKEKLPYPPIKVLFPTLKTVQGSVYGEMGGSSFFCRRKQWAAEKFPRHLFHDSKSLAGPVLMHTKMILGLIGTADQEDSETEDSDLEIIDTNVGWAYLGSHNLTPSAWGTISGSSFAPVLNITNYELGIVFALKSEEELQKATMWERPPPAYGKEQPWIQDESQPLQELRAKMRAAGQLA